MDSPKEISTTPSGDSIRTLSTENPSTSTLPTEPTDPRDDDYISASKFHQSFTLPANPSHGRPKPIRVTYCDLDYRSSPFTKPNTSDANDTGPTILFLPGAGERRYASSRWADALAREHGVRWLHADHLGIGGTESVPLAWRIASYVDLVEELLVHLGIRHVALACHSMGAIYLFNVLLRLRHVLHPVRPLVCFMTPWVLPTHSKTLASSAARVLPNWLLRRTHVVDQKVLYKIQSVTLPLRWKWYGIQAWFYELPLKMKGKYPCSEAELDSTEMEHSMESPKSSGVEEEVDSSTKVLNEKGSDPDDAEEDWSYEFDCSRHLCTGSCIDPSYLQDCIWAENGVGVGQNVLVCLKRQGIKSWGVFKDYDEAVRLLRAQELKLLALESPDQKRGKLRVQTFFAEKDSLIGKRGAAWFESLWMGQDDWVEYASETKEDYGHDEIPERGAGCLDWFMGEVVETWGQNAAVKADDRSQNEI